MLKWPLRQTFGLPATTTLSLSIALYWAPNVGTLRTLIFISRLRLRLKYFLHLVLQTTLWVTPLILPYIILVCMVRLVVSRVRKIALHICRRLLAIRLIVIAWATLERHFFIMVLKLTAMKLFNITGPLEGILRGKEEPPLDIITKLKDMFLSLPVCTKNLTLSTTLPLAWLGWTWLRTQAKALLASPRVVWTSPSLLVAPTVCTCLARWLNPLLGSILIFAKEVPRVEQWSIGAELVLIHSVPIL